MRQVRALDERVHGRLVALHGQRVQLHSGRQAWQTGTGAPSRSTSDTTNIQLTTREPQALPAGAYASRFTCSLHDPTLPNRLQSYLSFNRTSVYHPKTFHRLESAPTVVSSPRRLPTGAAAALLLGRRVLELGGLQGVAGGGVLRLLDAGPGGLVLLLAQLQDDGERLLVRRPVLVSQPVLVLDLVVSDGDRRMHAVR